LLAPFLLVESLVSVKIKFLVLYFDTDLETSIERTKDRERICQKLRQTDRGCCGAPVCLTYADDFVRGEVKLTDGIFLAPKELVMPRIGVDLALKGRSLRDRTTAS
jgi:hypothetical protein